MFSLVCFILTLERVIKPRKLILPSEHKEKTGRVKNPMLKSSKFDKISISVDEKKNISHIGY